MLPHQPLHREAVVVGRGLRGGGVEVGTAPEGSLRCRLASSPQDQGRHLHPQLLSGRPGWNREWNAGSPPSAPFSLPSLLQPGWELGKLATGAEEAIWRAQSPHTPVAPLLPMPTPPCGWLSGAPYTRCLWYPPDNIQVASITAGVQGGHTSSPLLLAPASPSRHHHTPGLLSPPPPV